MKSIFRQGDRVYHFLYGWGDVIQIVTNNNYLWVRVQFDDKPKDFQDNFKDGFLLSFTEYKLEGFSKERPEELPKKGQIVWGRDEDYQSWHIYHFSHKTEDGIYHLSSDNKRNMYQLKQITTKNPFENE